MRHENSRKIYVVTEEHLAQLEKIHSDMQNLFLDIYSNYAFQKNHIQLLVEELIDRRVDVADG